MVGLGGITPRFRLGALSGSRFALVENGPRDHFLEPLRNLAAPPVAASLTPVRPLKKGQPIGLTLF